jgi:uncharacterized protein (TIGR00297 family)
VVVLPFVCANAALETLHWAVQKPSAALWALGLSAILGAITFSVRAATPAAAATGAAITASLMYATSTFDYEPWRTAVVPVAAVFLLAFGATRVGRAKKERLRIAERRTGRNAAQVAANLGAAGLVSCAMTQAWAGNFWTGKFWDTAAGWVLHSSGSHMALFTLALAALAEAAADTVSSELGKVLGGCPRMITTLRTVAPGTDGAVSLAGTVAGVLAAGVVAAAGTAAVGGGPATFVISTAGGIFGLLFDSVLGATLERRGMLNNDAVNFLSTLSAAVVAYALAMR